MKNALLLLLAITMVAATACSNKPLVVKSRPPASKPAKPLPPGQAKKLTGSKSAKPYAPGQQKKSH
ncbi:hypothetical protein [Paraflavitalea sp. CAU 1676]|uniref:hypothetical protein n=1 Tax=Paraflavitalea sp. CAU 1676 TaxID=3032598 RepID=UPI0023DC0AB9|nr:hypothetical protein [Paraflavitalea sp. CAU 1676]MDF2192528.1 hypothetical protein [Paraflavitalea sp. CAU 1676]